MTDATEKVAKSDAEWRKELGPDEFAVLRKKGTEPSYSHPYHDIKEEGVFRCRGCGAELFSSNTKFDSRTGWPSFSQPISEDGIKTAVDHEIGSSRTEVMCARCGGHLGHVFDDGPPPTGLRYCLNGVSLKLDTEAAD
ncbi:peptide-methionine (R)-S-oxide reductase MsrB [Patescibacteria group bacterium]|nr:peptide-methionine (R)-S-oxide reductase MsrB [Patescibacteria group bacterium]